MLKTRGILEMMSTCPKKPNNQGSGGQRPHFTSLTSSVSDHTCVVCKVKHPLYVCSQFKSFNCDWRLSILKSNNLCLNCLGTGHFAGNCRSANRCQKCQKLHHTLLHQSQETTANSQAISSNSSNVQLPNAESVATTSNTATSKISSNVLLMTCRVLIIAPDGSTDECQSSSGFRIYRFIYFRAISSSSKTSTVSTASHYL